MLFLERIGIFDVTAYLQKWRIAILVIFVISMILSPGGDPYSMLLMAVPLTFLYFGGVLLCKYLPKGRNPFDPA
jgi:sec-independent protein translocase protein TatC